MIEVPTKYYKVLMSSLDVPKEIMRACCCAVGVVLGNYYHSNCMPTCREVKTDDEDMTMWEVSHAVADWGVISAEMHQKRP